MYFLNNPRKAITCYCFINLNLKKIFIANHKCGVSYFTHLFSQKYTGKSQYIDWKNTYKLGDWYLAVEREEIHNFANQYNEQEFQKIMVTRNPYDRALSFFTNTFWDVPSRTNDRLYAPTWKEMAGDRLEKLEELRNKKQFKEGFTMFLDIQWNNPTDGVKRIRTINNGLGDEHLYPQSLAYKGILTDVAFVDIAKSPSVAGFLGINEEICQSARNPSSNSRRVLEDGFFDDLDLTAFNEFYRDDFGLGYKICA